ncbi:hypothetical protein ILYODFUR_015366 [Ilyodon furcidens]|uniref:Uncharacterized protein n=1 Tax=Ilyodon furcidens TaxID=33524 RepID=A0ABV0TIV9_9TELE
MPGAVPARSRSNTLPYKDSAFTQLSPRSPDCSTHNLPQDTNTHTMFSLTFIELPRHWQKVGKKEDGLRKTDLVHLGNLKDYLRLKGEKSSAKGVTAKGCKIE